MRVKQDIATMAAIAAAQTPLRTAADGSESVRDEVPPTMNPAMEDKNTIMKNNHAGSASTK